MNLDHRLLLDNRRLPSLHPLPLSPTVSLFLSRSSRSPFLSRSSRSPLSLFMYLSIYSLYICIYICMERERWNLDPHLLLDGVGGARFENGVSRTPTKVFYFLSFIFVRLFCIFFNFFFQVFFWCFFFKNLAFFFCAPPQGVCGRPAEWVLGSFQLCL